MPSQAAATPVVVEYEKRITALDALVEPNPAAGPLSTVRVRHPRRESSCVTAVPITPAPMMTASYRLFVMRGVSQIGV